MMYSRKSVCGLIFTVVMCSTACSPTDGSNQVTLADLTGLWNSSEKYEAGTDIIYTRITSDGSIIEYDFDGDEIDKGLPCYQIDSGSVKALSPNHFLVTADMHNKKQFTVEIELLDAGHALKIYFLDETDGSTLSSQIWTREPDDTILDSEPSCKADR